MLSIDSDVTVPIFGQFVRAGLSKWARDASWELVGVQRLIYNAVVSKYPLDLEERIIGGMDKTKPDAPWLHDWWNSLPYI